MTRPKKASKNENFKIKIKIDRLAHKKNRPILKIKNRAKKMFNPDQKNRFFDFFTGLGGFTFFPKSPKAGMSPTFLKKVITAGLSLKTGIDS